MRPEIVQPKVLCNLGIGKANIFVTSLHLSKRSQQRLTLWCGSRSGGSDDKKPKTNPKQKTELGKNEELFTEIVGKHTYGWPKEEKHGTVSYTSTSQLL